MIRQLQMSLLLAGAMSASVAGAETRQKPGLWETTIRVDMGDSMPQIPPEMLEQMRGAGFKLPFAEPIVHRMCLLPEQVTQDAIPEFSDPESGCTTRDTRRTGDEFNGRIACNGQLRGEGTLRMQLTSPETYSGTTDFSGVAENNLPVEVRTDFAGRWLAAECGDVPPMGS
ncbi:DUF3617 domain-containing protein [Panacagrimonas sp.]|uniref:DUF3617 domain-containing protein n=1 Tax=Panacagrimonas sp. TaxID=2480088 RepID=UPI003B529402